MPRYDLHIQLLDPSEQTHGSNFNVGLDRPILVTGLQSLVNRWMKIFMTPVGSHPLRPQEGTEFAYLQGANVNDVGGLRATVAEYIDDASLQVQAVDQRSPWLGPDQRLRAATLRQFNLLGTSGIEFWVEITNQASQRLQVLIPYLVRANG